MHRRQVHVTKASRRARRGNRLGFWLFELALRVFGLRGTYGLLYFVCAYYVCFDRSAVRAAAAYISRRFPNSSRASQLIAVYRLFISLGRNLVDRVYMRSSLGAFDIRFPGFESLRAVVAQREKGFVLLMSHLGNWQLVMNALPKFDRKVHLLMRPEDNPAVRTALDIAGTGGTVATISPSSDAGGVLQMVKVIEAGDIVAIMGDRSYSGSSVEVRFLGEPARFPHAAFSLGAALACPVVALLSKKVTIQRYELMLGGIWHPVYEKGRPRPEQLREWVQEYVRVIERYVDGNPYQCFLFRDIWSESQGRHA